MAGKRAFLCYSFRRSCYGILYGQQKNLPGQDYGSNYRFVSGHIAFRMFGSSSYNPALSDLGGVYASRFSDMDLAIEISGRLSEDEAEETDIFMHENWGTEDIASDPAVFRGDPDSPVFDDGEGKMALAKEELNNRLLRWGISRRPDNLPPNADPGAPEFSEIWSRMDRRYRKECHLPDFRRRL